MAKSIKTDLINSCGNVYEASRSYCYEIPIQSYRINNYFCVRYSSNVSSIINSPSRFNKLISIHMIHDCALFHKWRVIIKRIENDSYFIYKYLMQLIPIIRYILYYKACIKNVYSLFKIKYIFLLRIKEVSCNLGFSK